MRKSVVALALITTILAGGYTAVWQQKANEAKQNFIEQVNKINDKVKPVLAAGMIRYESVETTGFPLAIGLTVHKPVVTIPASEVLKHLPKEFKLGAVKEGFNWIEEFSFGDKMVFSADVTGSKHTLTFYGDSSVKAIVNGQAREVITGSVAAPGVCHFSTQPSGFLKIVPDYKTPEEAIDAFREFDCARGTSSSKNEKGEEIGTSDGFHLGLTHALEGSNRSVGFKLNLNSQTYKAADTLINNYLAIITEATGTPIPPLPYSLSEAGKVGIKIDVGFHGPAHKDGFKDPNLAMNIDVNAFDITSDLYNSIVSMHMNTAPKGAEREGSLVVKTKGNVTERYDQLYAIQVEKLLTDLANPEGKTGSELTIAQSMAKLGSPKALVAALLPKFHDFGDMVLDIDIHGQAPNNPAQIIQAKVNLNAFDILTSLYGLKTKGNYVGAQGKIPSGNADFTCVNCDSMITDMGNYAIRVVNYINSIAPQSQIPVPTVQLVDGIKQFLHSIALNGTDPNAKDLNIALVMKEAGEFTVSGKSIMDIMQSYMINVAPFLPKTPAPVSNDIPAPAEPMAAPLADAPSAPVAPQQ